MDRLKCLVFSFYREDLSIKFALQPLQVCKMQLMKGSICIECLDGTHFNQLKALLSYISVPFAAIGIGREIVLYVPGAMDQYYSRTLPSLLHTDLFA